MVDVIVEDLCRDGSFRLPGIRIINVRDELTKRGVSSEAIKQNQKSFFEKFIKDIPTRYTLFFAVDFLSLDLLYNTGQDLSKVIFLSMEGIDYMLRFDKQHVKDLVSNCSFCISQSKKRADILKRHLGLDIDFEYIPISLLPIENKVRPSCDVINAIYSGYFAEWACISEFLESYGKSKSFEFSRVVIQGHSMGTELYFNQINKMINLIPNAQIDTTFYSEDAYQQFLFNFDVGIAFYKDLTGTENFSDLLTASGKIAYYLWHGLGILTNIRCNETENIPFLIIDGFSEHQIRQGLLTIKNQRQVFRDAAYSLASNNYNFDSYMDKISKRMINNFEMTDRPFPTKLFIASQSDLFNDQLTQKPIDNSSKDTFTKLRDKGLWSDDKPLRLHLGCGEQYLAGYINIDYPQSEHNVMKIKADIYTDITKLAFPCASVDEIRLHHVFEHFSRVMALALLIRWHQWLKIGGRLFIETPDLMGTAKMLLSEAPWHYKTAAVRHITGDQAAPWAYHIDQWFPERFERTLQKFGFDHIETKSVSWDHEPFLANVHATGLKTRTLPIDSLLRAADEILKESMVSDKEQATYDVWRSQLRELIETVKTDSGNKTSEGLDLTESLKKDFRNVKTLVRLAAIEIDRGNTKKAKNYLLAAKVLDPQNKTALSLLGRL